MARPLRIAVAILLSLVGLAAAWVSVTLPYTLNKEYGYDVAGSGIKVLGSPALGGLVGGAIAAACALGALHLLGRGRRIMPTALIVVGVVVVASVAGAWLGLRLHDPSGGLAASTVATSARARIPGVDGCWWALGPLRRSGAMGRASGRGRPSGRA